MNGYPAGTKCVITWIDEVLAQSLNPYTIGDVVEVLDITYIAITGQFCQDITGDRGRGCAAGDYAWPVDYLSPLEDPDTEQVTEQREERV